MRKTSFACAFSCLLLSALPAFAQKAGPAPVAVANSVVLNEGTVLRVRLMETLDSRTADEGDLINFEIADDVSVNGVVVVKSGAKVTGSVMDAQKSGMLKKARLSFTMDYAQAVDGQNIPLTSPGINRGGKTVGTGGLVAAAAISPMLIVIPGKNVIVKKGQEYNVYVGRTMNINVSM